ncbi:MAG: cytochrome D1 domain-containing protein, partial [Methylocella sp.]
MQNNHSNGSFPSFARGFAAVGAVLAMGLGLKATPAEAAPFAYVANGATNTVSVIDTAAKKPVATVPVGKRPFGVAVTPDGKHAYVTNSADNTVSVIDTATNTVMATVPVGIDPFVVAVTRDGKHAYVANSNYNVQFAAGTVSVIDTATNMVGAT